MARVEVDTDLSRGGEAARETRGSWAPNRS
jgi:hypothetical protein